MPAAAKRSPTSLETGTHGCVRTSWGIDRVGIGPTTAMAAILQLILSHVAYWFDNCRYMILAIHVMVSWQLLLKTRYRLTSITRPYHRLGFRAHQRHMLFESWLLNKYWHVHYHLGPQLIWEKLTKRSIKWPPKMSAPSSSKFEISVLGVNSRICGAML